MDKNIYIIGAGAVGKSIAVFLKLEGKDVTIIRGSVDDIPDKIESITIELNDKKLHADILVSSLSSHTIFDGILVLTNKSYGNTKLANCLIAKAKNTPIVLLQNGLGVENAFLENGFTNLYRCVLFTTCQNMGNNLVKFKPVAISQIGSINGNSETLDYIVSQLHNSQFRFSTNANLQPIIWKKALANCVFNSICPLLDVDNGIFLRNKSAWDLAKVVICECVVISKSLGIEITALEVEESVLMISKMSDGQLISTLQDIKNKRKTEIETLNFAVVKIAQELGIEHSVKQTKLLGELTKMKAELNFL